MTFVEKFGSEEVPLPSLTAREYEQIEDKVRAYRRTELVKYLDECNIKGTERFISLRDARPDHVTPELVYAHLLTGAGARYTVELALTKAGKEGEKAKELYDALDFVNASNLALALVRLADRRREGDPPENKNDPLP